jgi:flagella basal body P-ring formation protein FlgA
MKKMDIMKHVSILDQIRIFVFQNTPENFEVTFECLDETKNVVVDQKALKELNGQITERTKNLSAKDPRSAKYIEEFVARMLEALHKNGLVEIVDITENKQDPYADLRKQHPTN